MIYLYRAGAITQEDQQYQKTTTTDEKMRSTEELAKFSREVSNRDKGTFSKGIKNETNLL